MGLVLVTATFPATAAAGPALPSTRRLRNKLDRKENSGKQPRSCSSAESTLSQVSGARPYGEPRPLLCWVGGPPGIPRSVIGDSGPVQRSVDVMSVGTYSVDLVCNMETCAYWH